MAGYKLTNLKHNKSGVNSLNVVLKYIDGSTTKTKNITLTKSAQEVDLSDWGIAAGSFDISKLSIEDLSVETGGITSKIYHFNLTIS